MKLAHFLVAAALCSTSAIQAQTTPTQTAPASPVTLTPSSAAPALNPNSADNSRALPPAGAPGAIDNTMPTGDKRAMKRSKKDKSSMSDGKSKMKTKM